MYRPKPMMSCEMPAKDLPINVLVLNASLKHSPEVSSTEELSDAVIEHIKKYHPGAASETVRLADKNIPAGLKFDEGNGDEWPQIVDQIKKADIVIFATPIWWGQRSSLMQRIIERMDAFDEEAIEGGRSALLNKVAGVVITGSEDGAQQTLASIMEVLTFMKFTFPPEACAYWVGEVGQDPKEDRQKRLANKATDHMAHNLARNLIYYAELLKQHPMVPEGKPEEK